MPMIDRPIGGLVKGLLFGVSVLILATMIVGLFNCCDVCADNLDEITTTSITSEGLEQLGDMSTGVYVGDTEPVYDTAPQCLINVRLRVANEWGEFWGDFNSTNPYFVKTDNIFYALLIALQSEDSDAKGLSDAINVVDNFARELRAIQAGNK